MYTSHCEDLDCENCRRISEVRSEVMMASGKQEIMPMVQSVEEENRNKILKTIQKSIQENLLESAEEKESYFKSVEKVKDEIHCRIGCLIEVLRKRERELCRQADQSWRNEFEKINCQAIFKSLSKGLPETSPYELDFQCEFDSILSKLKNFGRVSNELKGNTSFKQLQVQDFTPSTLLLDTSLESAPIPMKNDKYEKLIKNLKEEINFMKSLVPKQSEVGLKRLSNFEILSDLQRCARRTENIKKENGLERFENLEILNDLQRCARRTERLKMFAKAQRDAKAQKDVLKQVGECIDLVQCKEVEKDNSSIGPSKNLEKLLNDEVQKFEDPTDVLTSKEFKPEGRDLSLEEMRKILMEIKLACPPPDNDSDLVMDEKLAAIRNNVKTTIAQFKEKQNSACGAELGKYDASDEDDMEIISRSEAASIPSEIPAVPPKNRFRFGRKRSWCPSLYSNKAVSRKNTASVQSPGVISPQEVITSFLKNLPSTNKHANPEPFSEFLADPGSSNVNDYEGMIELPITTFEEIPSVNEREISSSDGQGHDPSGALRSSFRRYLEKNAEDDWLSRQLQSAGNVCIYNRDGLCLEENLDQWLPAKDKQNLVADWLYTPQI